MTKEQKNILRAIKQEKKRHKKETDRLRALVRELARLEGIDNRLLGDVWGIQCNR